MLADLNEKAAKNNLFRHSLVRRQVKIFIQFPDPSFGCSIPYGIPVGASSMRVNLDMDGVHELPKRVEGLR